MYCHQLPNIPELTRRKSIVRAGLERLSLRRDLRREEGLDKTPTRIDPPVVGDLNLPSQGCLSLGVAITKYGAGGEIGIR